MAAQCAQGRAGPAACRGRAAEGLEDLLDDLVVVVQHAPDPLAGIDADLHPVGGTAAGDGELQDRRHDARSMMTARAHAGTERLVRASSSPMIPTTTLMPRGEASGHGV